MKSKLHAWNVSWSDYILSKYILDTRTAVVEKRDTSTSTEINVLFIWFSATTSNESIGQWPTEKKQWKIHCCFSWGGLLSSPVGTSWKIARWSTNDWRAMSSRGQLVVRRSRKRLKISRNVNEVILTRQGAQVFGRLEFT